MMNHDSKGITLVECMIAVFLTVVAVIGLMAMQSLSWQSAGKSDYLGQASGILQKELEARENDIMRGTIPAPSVTQPVTEGNITFTVVTKTSYPATNKWIVNVNVSWPSKTTGIESSIIVTRQMGFNSADVF